MIEFGKKTLHYLKIVRSKAKMLEFDIPKNSHIIVPEEVTESFLVALAIVADIAERYFEDCVNHRLFDSQLKNQLHNAAEYFDALMFSELGNSAEYRDYIAILGATAYYLGDYNGSSRVMLSYLSDEIQLVDDSVNLASVFIKILKDEVFLNFEPIVGKYSDELTTLF